MSREEPKPHSSAPNASSQRGKQPWIDRQKAINKKLATTFLLLQKPVPDYEVLSEFSAQLMSELSDQQIELALQRVVRECEWLTPKAVFDRAPGRGVNDGRPDVETAWALCPKSDDKSIVWTDEMAGAFGIARRLLAEGDEIAARMAFKENYTRLVAEARLAKWPTRWRVSLGWDKNDRVRALEEAVRLKRIPAKHAAGLLEPAQAEQLTQLLLPATDRKQLKGKVADPNAVPLKLPGLYGVLQKLAEDKSIAMDIPKPKPTRSKLTDEQLKARREQMKKQTEFLRTAKSKDITAAAEKIRADHAAKTESNSVVDH